MEKELFQAILRDPALLSEVDEVILDQWIRDYPFAGWPHVMRALKRKQEGRLTDLDVHRAAMYVSDRAGLYEWLEWEESVLGAMEQVADGIDVGEGNDGMTVRRQDGMTDEGLDEEDTNVETQDFESPEDENDGVDETRALGDNGDGEIEGGVGIEEVDETRAVEDHGDGDVEEDDGMTVRRQDGMTDEGVDENVGAKNIAPENNEVPEINVASPIAPPAASPTPPETDMADKYESLPDTDDPFIGWLRAHRLGTRAVEDHGDGDAEGGDGIEEVDVTRSLGDNGDGEVEEEDGMTVRRQDGMTDEGLDENVGAQNIAPETVDADDDDDGDDDDVGAQNIAPEKNDAPEKNVPPKKDKKTKRRKDEKKEKEKARKEEKARKDEKDEKNGKKEKQPPLKKLIARSIVQDQEIASEPLADLLAKQGHVHQAILMYERLALIFPEKSAFFALKIKKLKKK